MNYWVSVLSLQVPKSKLFYFKVLELVILTTFWAIPAVCPTLEKVISLLLCNPALEITRLVGELIVAHHKNHVLLIA